MAPISASSPAIVRSRRSTKAREWQTLADTVLIVGTAEAPFPSDRFDKVTMAAFFSPEAREHEEDFEHSRIELYPGEIDRLW